MMFSQVNIPNSKLIYLDCFRFQHPATVILAGPTRSGKTTLISKILDQSNDGLVAPPPDRIVYCYSEWQDSFDDIKMSRARSAHFNQSSNAKTDVEFVEGLPDIENFDPRINNLLILDDLMTQCGKNPKILELFTVCSHHKNISVFFITQNVFAQEKNMRSISLNSQYIILTNNPRDKLQLVNLAKQVFPGGTKFFAEAYNDAVTQKKFGYLLLDLNQNTAEENRLQTGILKNEERVIYRKK
jgi:hypothetical protein